MRAHTRYFLQRFARFSFCEVGGGIVLRCVPVCVCVRSQTCCHFSLTEGTVVVRRLELFGFFLVAFYFCPASNAAWLIARGAA